MRQQDTNQLLRERNAGIKMAIDTIKEVLPNVKSQTLKEKLEKCEKEHERLGDETHSLLCQNRQSDEEPGMMAKGMSWMKTNMKMSLNPGDDTIADLISTGCDMGVRTLCRYLNRCKDASEQARSLVKRVIKVEEELSVELRTFL